MDWYWRALEWPFPVDINTMSDALLLLTMFGILLHRFSLTRRQEERLARELEAARVVQQVLIPEKIPAISGFSIASVYKLASQVGGNFFQIISTMNGGVLVVIGDVSGKGMPAAMTVSLLVGTARTLAHFTQSPGEILTAMNQRMLARSARRIHDLPCPSCGR
jgi:serine phosphatase RsbU (regulator of sigma subunit)